MICSIFSPPSFTVMRIVVAPASSAFSSSSLMAFDGRWMILGQAIPCPWPYLGSGDAIHDVQGQLTDPPRAGRAPVWVVHAGLRCREDCLSSGEVGGDSLNGRKQMDLHLGVPMCVPKNSLYAFSRYLGQRCCPTTTCTVSVALSRLSSSICASSSSESVTMT